MLFSSCKILRPVASLVVLSMLMQSGLGYAAEPEADQALDEAIFIDAVDDAHSDLSARLLTKIAEHKNLVAAIDEMQIQLQSAKADTKEYAVEAGVAFALFAFGGWATGGFKSYQSRVFQVETVSGPNFENELARIEITKADEKLMRSEFQNVLHDRPGSKPINIVLEGPLGDRELYRFSNRRELSEYAFDMMTRHKTAPAAVDDLVQAKSGSRLFAVLDGLGITYVTQRSQGVLEAKTSAVLSKMKQFNQMRSERSRLKFKGETANRVGFAVLVTTTYLVGAGGLVRGVQLVMSGIDAVRLSTVVLPNLRQQLIEVEDDLVQASLDLQLLKQEVQK